MMDYKVCEAFLMFLGEETEVQASHTDNMQGTLLPSFLKICQIYRPLSKIHQIISVVILLFTSSLHLAVSEALLFLSWQS